MAAVLCLGGLTGCASTKKGDRPGDVGANVTAASDRILWYVTLLALEKSGFPPGTDLNPGDMVAISGWMMSLAPFKGDGYREQATVWLERLEGHEYQVDVRVVRERNESLTNPLDPTVAKWKTDADNLQRARLVLQHIQSELGIDYEVGVKRSHEKFDKQ